MKRRRKDCPLLLVLMLPMLLFALSLSAQDSGAPYLIITHDNYYDALLPLAQWKRQKGMKTRVVKLSEIGSDSAQIRNYVVNAFNTWQNRPKYLLLVGNHSQIPFRQFYYYGYAVRSDNYYTDVTGDFHNEILPGRFWVNDSFEAQTIVAKVVSYEKNPDTLDPWWFKRGMTIVSEDSEWPPGSDSIYWADARYAHDYMLNSGFVHIDSLSKYLGHDSIDVVSAVNTGCSIILYRGLAGGYWDYPFHIRDVTPLHNGFKLPIVISATCNTVDYMGREWLSAGTPTSQKGVVGYVASSTLLMEAAEYRSALAKGTLDGFFSGTLTTLGQVVERGRLKYVELFGNALEYYAWTCLGDPAMHIRTDTPKNIKVTHYPQIWTKESLTVKVEFNATPVESALVCVMAKDDSSVYYARYSDQYGQVSIIDTLYFPDTALITVTGNNLMPAFDTVMGVHPGGPLVIYYKHAIIDTANGNGNYEANNGETIDVALWVLNGGDSVAHGVTGILQKAETDDYYQLADTVKYFGDILSTDSAFTSADGFDLIIDQYCPDSHLIKLKLLCIDIDSSAWTTYLNLYVSSPRPYLIYLSHQIIDSIGGNGNSEVNPGEDIELPVWLRNIGDSLATNVSSILRKQNPDDWWFSLYDTVKPFGDILPGDSAWTGADGFNVLIDSACPDLQDVGLQVALKDSLDSLWLYDFHLTAYAPVLELQNYHFYDSLKYLNEGDTANLVTFIRNTGSQTAYDIAGNLTCGDTLITIISGAASFDSVAPGGIGSNLDNPFVIAASPGVRPGHKITCQLELTSWGYEKTLDVGIYIGRRDYLVWDPDPNHSSGSTIFAILAQLDYLGDYRTIFPREYLNLYKAFFVCSGMYPNNYIIYDTSSVVPEIEHYMAHGGNMYLEGGDVWYYDPSHGGYDFCSLFCIAPLSNNIGYFTGVHGINGTFTQGMSFTYSGESNQIDRINPAANGIQIFENPFNHYSIGVAADNRTAGISVEIGGLVNGIPPSTRKVLLDSIMGYFGIEPYGIGEMSLQTRVTAFAFDIFPNPSFRNIRIAYRIPAFEKARQAKNCITVYDVMGRRVKVFENLPVESCNTMVWDCRDEHGREIPQGVYFVRYDIQNHRNSLKVVFVR